MSTPIFDRVPSRPDPVRMQLFDVATTIEGLQPRSYTWRVPYTLDQGVQGACVGHGWTHEAAARPTVVDFTTRPLPDWAARTVEARTDPAAAAQAFAFDAYEEAQRWDEWPGESYSGTSVAAGAKTMARAGLIGEYRWTRSVDDAAVAISRRGPAVAGLDWYDGMFRPDSLGYLNVTGRVAGGHCILINGYNVARRAFSIHNSWGSGWGANGAAWLRRDDLARLMADGGELCIPVQRHR